MWDTLVYLFFLSPSFDKDQAKMSYASSPEDPYRSPAEPFGNPYTGPRPGGRPGGLTAICVIAIVLGGLMVLGGLVSLVTLALNAQIQQAMQPPRQQNLPAELQEMQEAQQKMTDDMNAVTNKFLPINIPMQILFLAVAVGLLVGGGKSLGLNAIGRSTLMVVCGVALLAEIAWVAMQLMMQMEVASIMQSSMTEMMRSAPGNNGPEAEIMGNAMMVGIVIGVVISLGWALAKAIFYIVALLYLRKPHIAALFEPAYGPQR